MTLARQRCLRHPSREAAARCPGCGHSYCRECVTEHDDRVLCVTCLSKQTAQAVEREPRWIHLGRAGQVLGGLVVAWLFFYWLGLGLLAIPSSFHEGTVWSEHLLDAP